MKSVRNSRAIDSVLRLYLYNEFSDITAIFVSDGLCYSGVWLYAFAGCCVMSLLQLLIFFWFACVYTFLPCSPEVAAACTELFFMFDDFCCTVLCIIYFGGWGGFTHLDGFEISILAFCVGCTLNLLRRTFWEAKTHFQAVGYFTPPFCLVPCTFMRKVNWVTSYSSLVHVFVIVISEKSFRKNILGSVSLFSGICWRTLHTESRVSFYFIFLFFCYGG